MTQQIEPVIFRHDVSCPFGPRKQPPPSKTAVSQQCSLFSPHPLQRKGSGSSSRGGRTRRWGLTTLHPMISASHREDDTGPASSWRATARRSAHPENLSFPHKLTGSHKSMRNNFSLIPCVLGSQQAFTRLGLLHRRGSCMAKLNCQRPWGRNTCA